MTISKAPTITPDELKTSAAKYQKELMLIPTMALKDLAEHITFNYGIRFKEIISMIKGKAQFGPYKEDKSNKLDLGIEGQPLETFLGNCVETFDPNSLVKTIWGENATQGKDLKNSDLAKMVLSLLQKGVGEDIHDAVWSAVRKEGGATAQDLFNGLDTITTTKITEGVISVENGNLQELPEITSVNALDVLKDFYRKADPKLKRIKTKLYVPTYILDALEDDYATTRGVNSYNTKFEVKTLEGSRGKCEIVPLDNKEGSPYIHLSPKINVNLGFNLQGGTEEKMGVEAYAPFTLTFFASQFVGAGFRTFNKEFLKVGKLNAVVTKPEGGE